MCPLALNHLTQEYKRHTHVHLFTFSLARTYAYTRPPAQIPVQSRIYCAFVLQDRHQGQMKIAAKSLNVPTEAVIDVARMTNVRYCWMMFPFFLFFFPLC